MAQAWLVPAAGSIAVSVLLATNAGAQVQLPRFVPDVIAQFDALTTRPDPMAFEIGDGPDPSQCRHHQGLIRTEAADGTPYFIVSRSGPPRDDCFEEIVGITGNPIANLYIVRMGSRDKNGERLRSNRMQPGVQTTNTPPDPRDRVVRSISYDVNDPNADWPHYDHPGGMQQVGHVVAVGVTYPPLLIDPSDPFPIPYPDPDFPRLFVQFLDVTDPENPSVTSRFVPAESDAEAGVTALTPCSADRAGMPCATGHYLLAISGGTDNGTVHFYESTGTDLSRADLSWNLLYTWRQQELVAGEWHAHQTLQFLREHDLSGALYLAGARGPGRSDPDYIDLYRVTLNGAAVVITQVSSHHLISHPAGEGETAGARIASLAAASTFYVSPSGELLFYAAEHDNDGAEGSNGRSSVKMGEWRHRDMVRPDSPTRAPSITTGGPYVVDEGSSVVLEAAAGPPMTKAWIQLFEDPAYANRGVLVDYDDRTRDDFNDFRRLDPGFFGDVNGANDEASSWRWFAPAGCSLRANDDDFDSEDEAPGTKSRTLPGTGVAARDANLLAVANDLNTDNMDDAVTSVQFLSNCEAYYDAPMEVVWDFDLDGTPETTGSAFTFVAEEGPDRIDVPVQARHPLDGRTASASVAMTIRNVAPTIASTAAFDAEGRAIGSDVPFVLTGRPVALRAAFSDPGRLDHQTGLVTWADGSTDHLFDLFTDAFDGVEGRLQDGHTFAVAGAYDIAVDITDDDLGTARATVHVTVVSPEHATAAIIALLDAAMAATSNGAALKWMAHARKSLAGSAAGVGNSGALHKLQEGQAAAALAHLQSARSDLERARAAGGDTALLVALLDEVIAAVAAGA